MKGFEAPLLFILVILVGVGQLEMSTSQKGWIIGSTLPESDPWSRECQYFFGIKTFTVTMPRQQTCPLRMAIAALRQSASR